MFRFLTLLQMCRLRRLFIEYFGKEQEPRVQALQLVELWHYKDFLQTIIGILTLLIVTKQEQELGPTYGTKEPSPQ